MGKENSAASLSVRMATVFIVALIVMLGIMQVKEHDAQLAKEREELLMLVYAGNYSAATSRAWEELPEADVLFAIAGDYDTRMDMLLHKPLARAGDGAATLVADYRVLPLPLMTTWRSDRMHMAAAFDAMDRHMVDVAFVHVNSVLDPETHRDAWTRTVRYGWYRLYADMDRADDADEFARVLGERMSLALAARPAEAFVAEIATHDLTTAARIAHALGRDDLATVAAN